MTRPRLLMLAGLGAAFVLPGPALAGKKNKKKTEEPAAEAAPPKVVTKLPKDATSKAFGEKLLASRIVDFEPPGVDGLPFLYDTFTFHEGNTWTAEATLDAGDEKVRCTESGTWTVDAAESETVGPVNWTLGATDCPGRTAGATSRAQFEIQDDGDVKALFR